MARSPEGLNSIPNGSLIKWPAGHVRPERLVRRACSKQINGIKVYSYRMAARVLAWIGIVGIVILSVVPANERPTLAQGWFGALFGHLTEHVAAFALVAAAFAIGYRFSLFRLLTLALCYCAGIELLQIPLPTRHC